MKIQQTGGHFDRLFLRWGQSLGTSNEETPRCWFRGTLFNTEELAHALRVGDLHPKQLICEAFQRWGERCVDHLEGDYAFALYDERRHTVFAARDPSGTHPLYYRQNDRFCMAGDQLSSFDHPKDRSSELDPINAIAWLDQGNLSTTGTLLSGVKRLPPGHCAVITRSECTVRRFWRPELLTRLQFTSPIEAAEAYADLLQTAISNRLHPTEPTGTHVSGGIDSSAIGAWATQQTRRSMDSFAWQPPPSASNVDKPEYRLLQSYTEAIPSRLHYCATTPEHILEVLQANIARHPWALANVLSHERTVQHRAKQAGIQHLLSGWGGDEIASYAFGRLFRLNLLAKHHWRDYLQTRPRSARQTLRDLSAYAWLSLSPSPWIRHQQKMRKLHAGNIRSLTNLCAAPFWGPEVAFTPSMQKRRQERLSYLHPDMDIPPPPTPQTHSNASPQLDHYLRGHLANRIEANADSGREMGLRYHYPLLDRRVMEFTLRLPYPLCVHPLKTRWIYRQAVSSVLPPEIAWHSTKLELKRRASLNAPMRTALALAGQRIHDRATQPSRASYIDMPRLMKDLEPKALEQREHFGPLFRAVCLLDF